MNNKKDTIQYELHYLQKSSLFIGLIGLSYFFISLHHLYKPEMIHYSQYLVFIIIIISIEKIFTSLWGIYKTRRIKSPHILSIKIIDFIDAVVSIIVTRSIVQDMTQHNFGIQTSGILGIISSLLFISIAMYMYKIYKKI